MVVKRSVMNQQTDVERKSENFPDSAERTCGRKGMVERVINE